MPRATEKLEDKSTKEQKPTMMTPEQIMQFTTRSQQVATDAQALNSIELRVKIMQKKVTEGKEKINKDDGKPIIGQDGFPLRWDDRFHIDYTFEGGEAKFVEVSRELYDNLSVGHNYIATGIFAKISNFDNSPSFKILQVLPLNDYISSKTEQVLKECTTN
jgi:hypothetical protein